MTTKPSYTPALRFPDFLNDGEWEVKRLGEIAELYAGATPSTTKLEYWKGGTIPWMSSGEVHNGQIFQTEKKITTLGYDNCSTKLVPQNSVVVALAGQGKTRGTVAITRIQLCTNQSLCSIIPNSNYCSDYLYFYLGSQYEVLRQISSGDGTRGGLNLQMLKDFLIPFPPLAEQRRIAACLSALDEMLAATNEKLELMKAYKKGLMQKLFPAKGKKLPELRFKEFEKDGEWTVKGLGEFVDVFQGYGFPERMQGKTRGKYPFIKVSDISMTVNNGGKYIDVANNYVDEEDLPILGATPFPFGTIVFAKIGEAIRLNRRVILSKPSLIDNNVGGVKAKDGLSNDGFVFYIMSMIDLVKYAGGVVPAVKKTTIENIEVLMPPTLDEQQKIAEVLTSIDRTIMQKTKKTNLLKKYKKGLMQQMFPTSK